mmetsp:Transcript_35917/g.83912  ORF Transcript_35917/g.83912 Transcript_35917/m.83912 type:complete len:101 (+) Transcript_35917:392-694(+)
MALRDPNLVHVCIAFVLSRSYTSRYDYSLTIRWLVICTGVLPCIASVTWILAVLQQALTFSEHKITDENFITILWRVGFAVYAFWGFLRFMEQEVGRRGP